MEVKEVIDALDPKLKAYKDEMAQSVKEAKEANEKTITDIKEWQVKKDESDRKNQEALDALIAQGVRAEKTAKGSDFGTKFAEAVEKNAANIQRVSKGKGFEMDVKEVGTMTLANNLTGEGHATYQPGVINKPGHKVNLRNLVGTFPSDTGIYVQYRETGGEGAFGLTSAGGSKSQVDYDDARVVYNAVYISAYTVIAKEMLQDLKYMQTVLPQRLLRDFYKKENTTFFADLKASAWGGTAASGTNTIEKFIHQIGYVGDQDYDVNGILMLPSDLAAIQITKPSDYGLPGNVSLSPSGQVAINGIPVYTASWATNDYMTLGDWSNARIGVVDGLKVEFFEQDSDNVRKNLVTVRVEAREFLAIDDPYAFVHKSL